MNLTLVYITLLASFISHHPVAKYCNQSELEVNDSLMILAENYSITTISHLVSIESDLLPNETTKDSLHHSPIEITPRIQVNKIYDINTLQETYMIDGYFVATWKFDSSRNDIKCMGTEKIIYENEIAEQKMGTEIWVPAFEFINVVGKRDIGNKQLIITPDSNIIYNERFNATFTNFMDFTSFPFDKQSFAIQLEAFSYDDKSLIFVDINKHSVNFNDDEMPEEWQKTDERTYINTQEYSHLDTEGGAVAFSRFNLEVDAKRKIRYYLWQIILPLYLIISISWSVFWITKLSDQLSTSFTLMLTVVAFNFHTSSILPNLPYSTFIESLITQGYLSIFISIIIIIGSHTLSQKREKFDTPKVLKYCRYIFPITYLIVTSIQFFIFLS